MGSLKTESKVEKLEKRRIMNGKIFGPSRRILPIALIIKNDNDKDYSYKSAFLSSEEVSPSKSIILSLSSPNKIVFLNRH